MFYDQFIDVVVQKHTLKIFSSLSQITPAPPFRINFTVSVTGKSWDKQKLPPSRSGSIPSQSKHKTLSSSDLILVGWIGNPPSYLAVNISSTLLFGKSVDWNRRVLHLYWTRVRNLTWPYKHISSSATFSMHCFQLNLYTNTRTWNYLSNFQNYLRI